jgi:hypothetical protein
MKKNVKRLALHRETVRELQRDELSVVAGGALPTQQQGCLDSVTPSCKCTGYYPSLNAPCTIIG